VSAAIQQLQSPTSPGGGGGISEEEKRRILEEEKQQLEQLKASEGATSTTDLVGNTLSAKHGGTW
jgi:hypothetical protein